MKSNCRSGIIIELSDQSSQIRNSNRTRMNAINFLILEHDKVRKQLAYIKEGSHRPEIRRALFDTLSKDLVIHEKMEHKIWYPHFRDNEKLDARVKHLLKEENHAERAIHKIQNLTDEKSWERHFLEFKREVEQHAKEEEEKLFPIVKEILSHRKLERIGAQMQQFKRSHKN